MEPKSEQEVRDTIASQIVKARKQDEIQGYAHRRDMGEYQVVLGGLANYFDYIKQNKDRLGSSLVIDVGAGKGVAVRTMKMNPMTEGLSIGATVLKVTNEVRENVGEDLLYATPVEKLRGINDNSVAGIISVYGMAYSQVPSEAVASVDRVLVPGGVVKAVFNHKRIESSTNLNQLTPEDFAREFYKRNYDVIIPEYQMSKVLLALKRPAFSTALELFEKDKAVMQLRG